MNKIARLPRRAVVTDKEFVTSTGTCLLTFRVEDAERFDFEPGQFVSIDCQHPELGYRRSPYCIATAPSALRQWRLLVRRIPEGPVSVHLTELELGDVVSFDGPLGATMWPRDGDDELVLMATGVGISPFLSLVDTLIEKGFDRPITLFWGLRLKEDVCLVEHLDRLAGAHRSFEYFISLSDPPRDWDGLRGRLTETVPPHLNRLENRRFFLSGNGAMVAEMAEALAAVGVSQSRVFKEVFFNASYRPAWHDVETIASRFTAVDARNLFEHLPPLG